MSLLIVVVVAGGVGAGGVGGVGVGIGVGVGVGVVAVLAGFFFNAVQQYSIPLLLLTRCTAHHLIP